MGRFASDSRQNRRHHVLEVREQVGVRQVLVGRHELAVHVDVEHSVRTGNERELGYGLAVAAKGFSRHPGGAQGVSSMLAVLQADIETVACHCATSCDGIGIF